jgi:hypothetical protein
VAMVKGLKVSTIDECLSVDSQIWAAHVDAYRQRAREQYGLALISEDKRHAEHWRLHAHILELDPRDWDGYGFLDRWEGTFRGERGDCSSGCAHYRPLKVSSAMTGAYALALSPIAEGSSPPRMLCVRARARSGVGR